MRRDEQAFSMIEVLVSLVIVCIGVLGMVALQTRSVALSQDSIQRTTAMALANDLLELMRSNPAVAMANNLFKVDGRYAKQPGTAFNPQALSSGETCVKLDRTTAGDTLAGKDLTCWLNQVKALLPVTDDLITGNFAVCPARQSPALPITDSGGGTTPLQACETTARATVMIVLAWRDPGRDSLNCPQGVCYYALRSEL